MQNHHSGWRLFGAGLLLVAVLVATIGTRVVMAQPTNPLLTALLTEVQKIVNLLDPPAGLVTLYSPVLNTASTGRQLRCSALNTTSGTLAVTFAIASSFSVVEGPTVRTIAPGESSDIATTETSSFVHCKVDFIGKKSDVRGHFVIELPLGGGDTEMVLSVPLS